MIETIVFGLTCYLAGMATMLVIQRMLDHDESTMPDGDASRFKCPVCGYRETMALGGCARCGN